KDSGLKCGFFINKNLTHEQENETLYRSKTAINIHDTYQRILGLDTNERTFKALGATGILVSDKVLQVSCLFPNTPIANTPSDMVALVKEELEISEEERSALKEKNRNNIIENHTYIKRAQEMLAL
ncbi:MAG TPA: glycosyltransferase family 1 protein, partial [Nitrospinaceae bacterium]|nr:glycosyltransferase family 1 protein [Nitrospinaceae bacterium]